MGFASCNAKFLARSLAAFPAVLHQLNSQNISRRDRFQGPLTCSTEPTRGLTEGVSISIPETVCPKLANTLQARVLKQGRLFDCTFFASKPEFDDAWTWSWGLLSVTSISRSCRQYEKRQKTTADSSNRLHDKDRVESKWGLKELGDSSCEFYDSAGELVACGYEAIVYGDHGPYIEFNEDQIHWPTFCQHKLKGPDRTHFEHYNKDVSIKLYDQFQTVANQPNPPPDNPFSTANNRPDGYADYRPGKLYISCDLFFSAGGRMYGPE
ncbi:unnamed protein product [Durusdinium trenchii]|uniref:Chloroplastic n=2 Tax=Durusdinium trenchii TaxID=1381693 RepID=A0ABP0RSW9_9DINO